MIVWTRFLSIFDWFRKSIRTFVRNPNLIVDCGFWLITLAWQRHHGYIYIYVICVIIWPRLRYTSLEK